MVLYIGCQRISNLLGHRQHSFPAALSRDTDQTFLPVKIAEPKANDITRP
jgi:hypothetical protein